MDNKKNVQKRYNLILPSKLFDEIKNISDSRGTTVVEIIRKFLKIGLLISEIQDNPNSAFIIREGDSEREVLIF